MKTNKLLTTTGLLTAMTIPATALGAGFQINEHAAKATARGGAVYATIDDASAIFFNPAGLTQIEGTDIQLGITMIQPAGEYNGVGINPVEGGAEVSQGIEDGLRPIPNAYLARQLSEKAYVGVGLYFPYGLGIEWADAENWVGRTAVQELELRTAFITPTIALELSENVSVAFSVSLVPASVFLRRTLGATDNGQVLFPREQYGAETDGAVELAGSAFGVGANAGVQVGLLENNKLKFGLAYRSAVGLDFSGEADFQLPEGVPPTVAANFPDGDVTASVTLPHAFALGIAWDDSDFTVEVGSQLTLWQSYEELRVNFLRELPTPSTASPRNWNASALFRLGGEYRFLESYAARAGFTYDMTPIPDETIDPTLPSNSRVIGSLGAGGKWGPFSLDLAFMILFLAERDGNESINFAPGTYSAGTIKIFSATAGLSF